jgi:hypothetical protein
METPDTPKPVSSEMTFPDINLISLIESETGPVGEVSFNSQLFSIPNEIKNRIKEIQKLFFEFLI